MGYSGVSERYGKERGSVRTLSVEACKYEQTKQRWDEVTSPSVLLRKLDFAQWEPSSNIQNSSHGPESLMLQQTDK